MLLASEIPGKSNHVIAPAEVIRPIRLPVVNQALPSDVAAIPVGETPGVEKNVYCANASGAGARPITPRSSTADAFTLSHATPRVR